MENYRKTSTRSAACAELESNVSRINIKPGGRISNYMNACSKFIGQEQFDIVGIGMGINKAVSLCEIIKRKHKVAVTISIFDVGEIDVWTSVDGDLDTLEITRHLPAIKLSISPVKL